MEEKNEKYKEKKKTSRNRVLAEKERNMNIMETVKN